MTNSEFIIINYDGHLTAPVYTSTMSFMFQLLDMWQV